MWAPTEGLEDHLASPGHEAADSFESNIIDIKSNNSFFIYQLMHKRIALKRILKFTLKQFLHVSV